MDAGSPFPEDCLSEWEVVHSPTSPPDIPATHRSGPSSGMDTADKVGIHNDGSSNDVVFPPTHHEGLLLARPTTHDQPPTNNTTLSRSSSSSSSSSSLSTTATATSSEGDDEAGTRSPWLSSSGLVAGASQVWICLRWRFGIVGARVLKVGSKFCDYKSSAGGFWAVASMTGAVAAVLLSLLYARVLRQWRPRACFYHQDKEPMERMVLLLREKDEKISQLLLRVAQMSDALSARRRVPVIRIG